MSKLKKINHHLNELFVAERADASEYTLTLLISAITTVLLTRVYLELTGFIQLAVGGLHIAHVLWGGLLLLVSNLIILTYHGKKIRILSAVLAGVGFGLFIDEAGKFLTSDNNYFFQPTIMLIYLFFIILYFIHRFFARQTHTDPKTLIYQALEQIEEIIEFNLDKKEKQIALNTLSKISSKPNLYQDLAKKLTKIVNGEKTIHNQPSKLHLYYKTLRSQIYRFFFTQKLSIPFLLSLRVLAGLSTIFTTIFILVQNKSFVSLRIFSNNAITPDAWSIVIFSLLVISEFTSLSIALNGLKHLFARRRFKALEKFKASLLISIFFTQVFHFFFRELDASLGLIANIAVLIGVQQLILQQQTKS